LRVLRVIELPQHLGEAVGDPGADDIVIHGAELLPDLALNISS
jgi:hypothetical protein